MMGKIQGFSYLRIPIQNKKLKKHIIDSKGQSVIEFLLTFGFTVMILFVFVKITINVTNGFMVHYATYMTSRSFLVHDNHAKTESSTDVEAERFAKAEVFDKILTSWKGSAPVFNRPASVTNKVYTGVRVDFEQNFAFGNMIAGNDPINFKSESFLGRIPVVGECVKGVCAGITGGEETCGNDGNTTLYDNGC